jgi:hypothetical protein
MLLLKVVSRRSAGRADLGHEITHGVALSPRTGWHEVRFVSRAALQLLLKPAPLYDVGSSTKPWAARRWLCQRSRRICQKLAMIAYLRLQRISLGNGGFGIDHPQQRSVPKKRVRNVDIIWDLLLTSSHGRLSRYIGTFVGFRLLGIRTRSQINEYRT